MFSLACIVPGLTRVSHNKFTLALIYPFLWLVSVTCITASKTSGFPEVLDIRLASFILFVVVCVCLFK